MVVKHKMAQCFMLCCLTCWRRLHKQLVKGVSFFENLWIASFEAFHATFQNLGLEEKRPMFKFRIQLKFAPFAHLQYRPDNGNSSHYCLQTSDRGIFQRAVWIYHSLVHHRCSNLSEDPDFFQTSIHIPQEKTAPSYCTLAVVPSQHCFKEKNSNFFYLHKFDMFWSFFGW